jgi:nucleotide-binding universal stress UspA family protein
MYTRILIPLDGSKTAEKVLPCARALSRYLNLPVELLSVIPIATMASHIAAERAKYLDSAIVGQEHRSRLYLENIAREFPGSAVKCTVKRGNPAEAIIERAAVDMGTLITMATHGRSGIKRWLLGSVAEKVLRGTPNATLLIRADDELDTQKKMDSITVPLDGSKLAESVLPIVTTIAKLMNLEIILFRAYELPASAYYGNEDYLPNYEELKAQVKIEVQSYLNKQIEELKSNGIENASLFITEGAGPEEIISYAHERPNTLIAMCTHGRSGVRGWVLGSVTEKVVRHSGDPVLVMRAP